MESKGRRASRRAAPIGVPAEPAEATEIRASAAEPSEPVFEARPPAEPSLERVEPMETAAEPGAVAEVNANGGTAKPELVPLPVTGPERDTLAPWIQMQAALARGLEAMSEEMAGLALKSMDATASAATKLLAVKTLSDAVAVNAGFTCSNFNALLGGSARLSELGVRLAAETSQPLLSQFGGAWIKTTRPGR
jgi:Phasin protein